MSTADDALQTPAEVAEQLRVTKATVARWARTGKLDAIRLPGGQLRFRRSDVEALLGDAA